MPTRYGGYTLDEIADAVSQVESSGGKNLGPRYEPGFQRRYGAKWLREGNAAQRQAMVRRFGNRGVYASYGAHQVMLPTAVELGFTGTPQQLADPVVNRRYFEKKFLRDFKATKGDITRALLRYNGGGDPDYPKKVLRHLTPKEELSMDPNLPLSPQERAGRRIYRLIAAAGLAEPSKEEWASITQRIDTPAPPIGPPLSPSQAGAAGAFGRVA